jgi:hypothetical protein
MTPTCEFCGEEIFADCDCPKFCLACEGIHRPSEQCAADDIIDAGLADLD